VSACGGRAFLVRTLQPVVGTVSNSHCDRVHVHPPLPVLQRDRRSSGRKSPRLLMRIARRWSGWQECCKHAAFLCTCAAIICWWWGRTRRYVPGDPGSSMGAGPPSLPPPGTAYPGAIVSPAARPPSAPNGGSAAGTLVPSRCVRHSWPVADLTS
jgi:hypothetical protein